MTKVNRPTSPHLSIYKPQITSVLSITHRMSGIALYAGALAMVAWLSLAAYAPAHYAKWYVCASSWGGRLLLLGWMLAFYFHLANGIRHLFWDMGRGYSLPAANRSGWMVILFTLAATAGSVTYVLGMWSKL
jgi:succinate dehydrogenase / fumarate reductase cytochrome b subunit